jgi:glycosyltransferase involved in cell wall biosynthesis
MKLLVIVPMYNASKFIEECLNSIVSQEVDMRIIVVNDASTDDSSSKVRKFTDVELLVNPKNMGTYYSINIALLEASNDPSWTHYLIHGADDVSYPNRFKKQFNLFKVKQTIAVGCRFQRVDYRTNSARINNPWVNESVLMISRLVFKTIGYYDSNRAGCDTEYRNRLMLAFPKGISQIDSILVKSYLHENNLTKRIPIGGKVRRDYVAAFTAIHKRMAIARNFYNEFKR